MNNKKTLVLGASENKSRYSYLAVKKLQAYLHPVAAIGKKAGFIGETEIFDHTIEFKDIHTVTLYLNPGHQEVYYNYLIGLKPKRIIFNPGAENEALASLAKENGIETIDACTLVMLSTGQY